MDTNFEHHPGISYHITKASKFAILYPFHFVNDFGTELIFGTENGFFMIIFSFTKAIVGSKMNSVPKSPTR